MNSETINNFDDEIDLKDLILGLWKNKFLILFIVLFSASISVYYSLSLANTYTSKALLAPSDSEKSLSSKLSGYSALAGFAGISMPSSKASKATEAIERIKSYDFFVNQFLPNVQLKDLIAANDWQQNSNSIIYNNNIYNIKDNTWTREASFPKTSMPSNQEAYEVYKEILSISEDKKTSFVTISITHVSPFIAKDWVDIIITNINAHMREIDISIAENSIVFLKETLITTSLSDIRRAMAQLLQDQIQVLMLAEASQDYIFKPIVSPIAPEKKSAPSRALICILGTLIGFMISVLLSLYLHYSKKNKY